MITNPIYSIIFLPMALFIGFKTITEDMAMSRIRNKWIVTGILYAFLIYGFFWILSILPFKSNNSFLSRIIFLFFQNFDKYCINLMLSTIVAFFLWYNKMWSAGDAKLFICYCALIPITQYQKIYFDSYFASFSLLLAIFIPATIFFALKALLDFIKRFKFFEMKNKIADQINKQFNKKKIKEASSNLFGFFVFFLFFKTASQLFSTFIQYFLANSNMIMIISLLGFNQLSKFFQKNTKFTIYIFVLTLLIIVLTSQNLSTSLIFNKSMLRNIFFIAFVFPLIKQLLNDYVENDKIKTTAFAHWIFLGALIIWFF